MASITKQKPPHLFQNTGYVYCSGHNSPSFDGTELRLLISILDHRTITVGNHTLLAKEVNNFIYDIDFCFCRCEMTLLIIVYTQRHEAHQPKSLFQE